MLIESFSSKLSKTALKSPITTPSSYHTITFAYTVFQFPRDFPYTTTFTTKIQNTFSYLGNCRLRSTVRQPWTALVYFVTHDATPLVPNADSQTQQPDGGDPKLQIKESKPSIISEHRRTYLIRKKYSKSTLAASQIQQMTAAWLLTEKCSLQLGLYSKQQLLVCVVFCA